jgi:hypothetical protein
MYIDILARPSVREVDGIGSRGTTQETWLMTLCICMWHGVVRYLNSARVNQGVMNELYSEYIGL